MLIALIEEQKMIIIVTRIFILFLTCFMINLTLDFNCNQQLIVIN